MSHADARPLRVALLHHTVQAGSGDAAIWRVARGLAELGHRPVVLSSHVQLTRRSQEEGIPVVRCARLPEAPLRMRGFTVPLTHIPLTLAALSRGRFHVSHAFTPQDAAIGILWRRRAGRPAVFTCTEPLERRWVAATRLQLRLLAAAVEESDAVTAPDDEVRASLARWMAVDAPVVDPSDSAAHEQLYRELATGEKPVRA